MKTFLNSPLFIAILVIAALFILRETQQPRIASEVEAVYDEIVEIVEDGGSDLEKTKALQTFAQEIAAQLKTGFSAGFSSDGTDKEKKESREAKFLRIREQLILSAPKEIAASRNTTQEFIYTIKNESDTPIRSLRINYEYFNNGQLIDVSNDWISEVKVLPAGESVAMKESRNLPRDTPEAEIEQNRFDSVKLSVTSFDPVED